MSLSDTIDHGEQEPGSCLPWEANTDCCPDWGDLKEPLQLRALSLAWSTIRSLTGGRVGSCPVTMRPCLSEAACGSCFGDSWLNPYVDGAGNWKNAACRRDGSCSCCDMCEIVMPGQVAAITEVNIDGYRLDRQLFRIDNGNRLVRQDGACWPNCQNLGAPSGAIGTVTIKYVPGVLPSEAGLWAAGVLACEFSKACSGAKCRLPSRVTSVARQGVSMEFDTGGMFDGGTGIREVDAYIESVNPNGLRTPPKVWSPDMPSTKHRITTSQVIVPPSTGPMRNQS